MYESFFGFVQRPFLAVSTLDRYFPATSIEQSFQTTARAVQRGEGPVAIFGGSGLGKTMCCLRIAENFRRNFEVIMLASSQLITRRALLQSLLFELRMPYRDMSEGELRLTLMNRLQPSTENPSDGLVLIVDEAQTLSIKLLEELRLLTNVVRNGVPRVRMVLCGTMRLEESLSHPHMDSLNQRLAARCYLTPLSIQETGMYVRHKIELSGVDSSSVMTREALDAIYRGSDGIPRLIDQLADQSLMLACNDRECPVSAAMVGRAWCMLQQLPNPWSEPESIATTDSQKASLASVVQDPTSEPKSTTGLASTTAPTVAFAQSNIEFGQLNDDFDHEESSEPIAPSVKSTHAFPTVSNTSAAPAITNTIAVNQHSTSAPKSKNLLDVFAGDFDEEFTIPVQSSDSYQSYSGAAYGNLNHDLSAFGTKSDSAVRIPQFDIEEANEFLSNPFRSQPTITSMPTPSMPTQSTASNEVPASAPIRPVVEDVSSSNNHAVDLGVYQYNSFEELESEPVSNISPEQAANLERQIEEEMRELVSGLNLNAMTFDPASSIDTISNATFQHDTFQSSMNRHLEKSGHPEEQRLSHYAHSDVLSFSNLHSHAERPEQQNYAGFDRGLERAAMSDDRDMLVVEDDLEAVRNGVQHATSVTNPAVLHPYAKLFTKLRNS